MTHCYTLTAPAKINLYLEIIGDRPDGYHELVMVLQSIDLADRLELRLNGTDQIRLHCDRPSVPLDRSNLAYRAAALMGQKFPQKFANYGGIDITLDKQIPVAAGLAGGSTDAAAVLVGLDLMWELGLTQPELQDLGAQLGSDVPFCLVGGTAMATGRGEQLDRLDDLEHLWVLLAKHSSCTVSTAWAYQTYRQEFGGSYLHDPQSIQSRTAQVHSGPLVRAIVHKDSQGIGQLLHNDLEKVVLPQYPQVRALREAFSHAGGLGSLMSGSGPTVFALCQSREQAQTLRERVREQIPDPDLNFWMAKLCSHGIQIAP